MPKAFDILKYLRETIAAIRRSHAIVVRIDGELPEVRRAIPVSLGSLTAEASGIRLDAQADDLDWFARELARLRFDFEIVKPAALRSALLRHLQALLLVHGGDRTMPS